jgi:integrase
MRGSITEVRAGVYRLRVYAGRDGKRQPRFVNKTVHMGKRDADRELRKMVDAVERGNTGTSTTTVSDLLDRWLDHCQQMDRSPTTLRSYHRLADKIVKPELGSVKLSKLGPADLDRLYGKLTKKGLKATSVRRVHALMSAALHQAERWGWIETNVARRASPPPVKPVRMQPPDVDQVRAIVHAAEARDLTLAPMLLLAALTGARRGELCALRWSDVDLASGVLNISRSIYEVAGGGYGEKDTKSHQHRQVSLDELAVAILQRCRAETEELSAQAASPLVADPFVFSRRADCAEPVRPDVLSKFTARVAKDAGVDTHLHMLRHFSATQLIAAGYDPVTVAARLGHRDAAITMNVYSHALQARDREAAGALGRALGPA